MSILAEGMLGWVIGLILCVAVVVAGFILLVRVRKALTGQDDPAETAEPFTLEALNAMRDNGQLTDEEYQRLRKAIVNSMRDGLESPK